MEIWAEKPFSIEPTLIELDVWGQQKARDIAKSRFVEEFRDDFRSNEQIDIACYRAAFQQTIELRNGFERLYLRAAFEVCCCASQT